jgi:hypothetical protein
MLDLKKQIRPILSKIKKKEDISPEENFQNEILRPIIKLQYALISSSFEHYLSLKKVMFDEFNDLQKLAFIQKSFKRDTQLKTDLRSLILGLFTLEEFNEYLSLKSQINRRINTIMQSRITSCYVNNS